MRYLNLFVLFLLTYGLNGQHTISGLVTNEKGEKLSFATVFLQGTNFAASTDNNGNFQITNIPSGSYVLKVTFIGYRAYTEEIFISSDIKKNIVLPGEIYNLDAIEIQSNRAATNAPYTRQNLTKSDLQKENLGQDVPFILQWTPSMVVTSDGGTGIGYTGLRLRGSDQTRVNVTINGVPLNDAESHNVFWVDLPDLMGSVNNIQIQRGVGTSTNGAGAFGGSVSVNTTDTRINPYIDVSGTLGAFNTRKLSVKVGTGLINDRYMIDARYSAIRSDGYVDRASSDLGSIYFSAARVTAKSSLRFNVINGKEITYQAWYGVPEAKVYGDDERLQTHYYNNLGSIYKSPSDSVNLFSSDRRYNYYTYPGQVDNYRQTHIQIIHALVINPSLKTKATLFYTKGNGYYEQYRSNDKLSAYDIPNFTDSQGNQIKRAEIVRRKWLNNDLAGILIDADYIFNTKLTFQAGIAANMYFGEHFGNVLSTKPEVHNLDKTRKYYQSTGNKSDISGYLRAQYDVVKKITVHGDMQVRKVVYNVNGTDDDLTPLQIGYSGIFMNPKVGVNFTINASQMVYASLAVANKEPIRSDFTDNTFSTLPKSEHLQNWEFGFRHNRGNTSFEANIYYMDYKNQLVLTGELNDVGAPVRVNVPESYRLGWESSFKHQINSRWAFTANATVSKNKITAFDEIIADYTNGFERVVIRHRNSDISFSPDLTGALQVRYSPVKNFQAEWSFKYVSRQFLDNTQNASRSLPQYTYQNIRFSYQLSSKYWKRFEATLMVNNLLDQYYSSNGYSYSYIYGSQITENFLYPQAGRHWMIGVNLGL